MRTQLSLYVPPINAGIIESARRLLDPVQAGLIPAHVTLCREDELEGVDIDSLEAILQASKAQPITLKFGRVEVFQGHGLLLPCIEGEAQFLKLRQLVLGSTTIRHQAPHITLAHPRNPRTMANQSVNYALVPVGLTITFGCLRVIQQERTSPRQVLAELKLADGEH
jgi:2'-5' RNA ligase